MNRRSWLRSAATLAALVSPRANAAAHAGAAAAPTPAGGVAIVCVDAPLPRAGRGFFLGRLVHGDKPVAVIDQWGGPLLVGGDYLARVAPEVLYDGGPRLPVYVVCPWPGRGVIWHARGHGCDAPHVITPDSPSWRFHRLFDAATEQEVHGVFYYDTETLRVGRYRLESGVPCCYTRDGRPLDDMDEIWETRPLRLVPIG